MARQVRIEFPGAVYHVMARGDRCEAIVRDDGDRRAIKISTESGPISHQMPTCIAIAKRSSLIAIPNDRPLRIHSRSCQKDRDPSRTRCQDPAKADAVSGVENGELTPDHAH